MAEIKLPRAYERKVTDFIVRGIETRREDWAPPYVGSSTRTDRVSGMEVCVDDWFVRLTEPITSSNFRRWNARRIRRAFRIAFHRADLAAAIALLDAAMAKVQG